MRTSDDEGQNEADQAKSLSKCCTNNHVGEEPTGDLRLACGCFLGLSHKEANTNTRANCSQAVADVGKGSGKKPLVCFD